MISIIIPTYNNADEVSNLLESIRPEIATDSGLEVIVVDDGSKDDSIEKVAKESGFVNYIKLKENRGPAAARNAGAKLAKNDTLLFLDSDVILNIDTLSKIKEMLRKDISISALCGEYDIEPANKSFFAKFKAIMAQSWIPRDNYITVFVARLGVIKKKIFDEVGGFNEDIRTASSEEWEFGRRLIDKGVIINYDPALTVRHHFPSFKRQVLLFIHRSFMWIYVFKKYKRFDNTCTTPTQALAQVFGFLTVLFMIISVFKISLTYLALFFLFLFIFMNKEFLKLTFKKEGLIFTLFSIPLALVLSCAVVLGGLWAVFHILFDRLSKSDK